MKILDLSKKEWAWALFDGANSIFITSIVVCFLPIYFKTILSSGDSAVTSTKNYAIILVIAGILNIILNPILGYINDKRGSVFGVFLSLSLIVNTILFLLFIYPLLFQEKYIGMALISILFACYYLILSIYDYTLVIVSHPSKYHLLSSVGYSIGYLVGGVFLIFHSFIFLLSEQKQLPDFLSKFGPWGIIFITTIIGWITLGFPLYKIIWRKHKSPVRDSIEIISLKESTGPAAIQQKVSLLDNSKSNSERKISEFKSFVGILCNQKNLIFFLIAYWLFMDTVNTVISFAADFALSFGITPTDILLGVILVQLVGFPFTLISGLIAQKWNSSKPLLVFHIGVYMLIVFLASQMRTRQDFWLVSFLVGVSQGGLQSLSRSLFSHLIEEHTLKGLMFGIFNLISRVVSVTGPVLISFLMQLTEGNHRFTILFLSIPLGLSLFALSKVSSPRNIA